jgi:hypothetical protein
LFLVKDFLLNISIQIDARIAAVEEEDKMHGIREGIQRSEAEQAEKARLRHKHALGQLKIEEVSGF